MRRFRLLEPRSIPEACALLDAEEWSPSELDGMSQRIERMKKERGR